MISRDRSIIKMSLYHMESSLVVHNPDDLFAVLFEMRIQSSEDLITHLNLRELNIEPQQGFILPGESKLFKVSAIKNLVPNLSLSQLKKRVKQKLSQQEEHQMPLATLCINCYSKCEYNRQVMIKNQMQNQDFLNKIDEVQVEIILDYDIGDLKGSDMGKQNSGLRKKSDNGTLKDILSAVNQPEAQRQQSKTEEFRKRLNSINLNTVKSTNFIKDHQEKGCEKFENSGLNKDLDIVCQRASIEQRIGPGLIKPIKIESGNHENQSPTPQLQNVPSIDFVREEKSPNYDSFLKRDLNPHELQKVGRIPLQENQQQINEAIDERTPPNLFQRMPLESDRSKSKSRPESSDRINVNFRKLGSDTHLPDYSQQIMRRKSSQDDAQFKANFDVVALAIISAVFVSLGNNISQLLFGEQ